MREIIFRGKLLNCGDWLYGVPLKERSGKVMMYTQDESGYVDPATVGEYTGLTDKNGVKIFEGDVVEYQFDNDDCPFPNKHTEKIIGRVFFSDHRASFSVTAGRNGSSMMNNDLFRYVRNGNRVKVIGNIHDDQDLLEADAHEIEAWNKRDEK